MKKKRKEKYVIRLHTNNISFDGSFRREYIQYSGMYVFVGVCPCWEMGRKLYIML